MRFISEIVPDGTETANHTGTSFKQDGKRGGHSILRQAGEGASCNLKVMDGASRLGKDMIGVLCNAVETNSM